MRRTNGRRHWSGVRSESSSVAPSSLKITWPTGRPRVQLDYRCLYLPDLPKLFSLFAHRSTMSTLAWAQSNWFFDHLWALSMPKGNNFKFVIKHYATHCACSQHPRMFDVLIVDRSNDIYPNMCPKIHIILCQRRHWVETASSATPSNPHSDCATFPSAPFGYITFV